MLCCHASRMPRMKVLARPAEARGTQCVAAREHGKVLQDNGVKERGHQFVGRNALLLQTVDIGLGKNAALARDGMDFDSLVGLVAQIRRAESSASH